MAYWYDGGRPSGVGCPFEFMASEVDEAEGTDCWLAVPLVVAADCAELREAGTPFGGGLVGAAAETADSVVVVLLLLPLLLAEGFEVGAEPFVSGDALTPLRLGETRCVGAARLVVLPALELWLPATLLLLLLRVEPTSRLKRWLKEDIGRSLSWTGASSLAGLERHSIQQTLRPEEKVQRSRAAKQASTTEASEPA